MRSPFPGMDPYLERHWRDVHGTVIVHARAALQRHELYAMGIQQRLPAIRIPLREEDADAVLDLQPLIDTAYAEGGYDDIDYRSPCEPALTGADAEWAEALLRTSGKR